MLQINPEFCNAFDNKATVVFKRNENIEQLIGGQLIKYQTAFNIRLNDHRKDVSNPSAIPVYIHFRNEGCNFIQHTKLRTTN